MVPRIAPDAQRGRARCDLWDAHFCGAYAAAVGAIAHVPVAACSAYAGVICVDVMKRCIANAHMLG